MRSHSIGILIGLLLVLQSVSVRATELARVERSKDAVLDFALEFRKAILERNMPYLKDVTSESGGIGEADFPFIYGDGSVHKSGDAHSKSVEEILSSDKLGIAYEGGIDRSTEKGRGAKYLLIYYLPKRNQFHELWLAEILAHRKWMVDYVACQVERKGRQWKLMWSFCYAETEGP